MIIKLNRDEVFAIIRQYTEALFQGYIGIEAITEDTAGGLIKSIEVCIVDEDLEKKDE